MKGQQDERDSQIAEALPTEKAMRESQGQQLATHISDTGSVIEGFVANQLPHLINQRVAEALQVERIRGPQTYSKEEVDLLVQQAVTATLVGATGGSRESTPQGRNQSAPSNPPANPGQQEKGKGREGPPQGPPAPPKPPANPGSEPSSFSSSDHASPPPQRQDVLRKRGENYYFTVQAPPAHENSRPRCWEATEPWRYLAEKREGLRAWILACEDYFSRNP
jgi:hypothetical protein